MTSAMNIHKLKIEDKYLKHKLDATTPKEEDKYLKYKSESITVKEEDKYLKYESNQQR